MSPERSTTHEWRCESCGLTVQGRLTAGGLIRATNAPPSGEVKPCTCLSCSEVEA